MHTHKLIRLIRSKPMLYNFEMEDYNNKIVAERKWQEIAIEMNASVSECKTKWNSLRTAYNTYLNKLKRMKKPRTKWIHADEMAFLKQYLKRNRYHNNNNNNNNNGNYSDGNDADLNHGYHYDGNNLDGMNGGIMGAAGGAYFMLKDESISNGCAVDSAGAGSIAPPPLLAATAASMLMSHLPHSTTHPSSAMFGSNLINLSTKNPENNHHHSSNHQPLRDTHVDVETCDDEEEEDDHDDDCGSSRSTYPDQDEKDPEIRRLAQQQSKGKASPPSVSRGGKQEYSDSEYQNHRPMSVSTTKKAKKHGRGERMKRITIEAPESMLVCFHPQQQNHHLNHHRNGHRQHSTTTTTTPINDNAPIIKNGEHDLIGSEFDIFSEFVAMKLKTFSCANRLDCMTKIWHIISECTLREFSPLISSPITTTNTNVNSSDHQESQANSGVRKDLIA